MNKMCKKLLEKLPIKNLDLRNPWLITAICLTVGAGGTLACMGINGAIKKNELDNIQNNISTCDFVEGECGSIDNKEVLSDWEQEILPNEKFTFITVRNDMISLEQLQKAIDESKDIGLIVKPTNYTYASIYKTIDSVKAMLNKYEITCPILYDISELMDSDTIIANCRLAEEFCNKLSANGCYVGIYGKEEDMKVFSDKFIEATNTHSLDLYDKMVVIDSPLSGDLSNIDTSVGNMFQFSNGAILWKYQLSKIIKERGINNPSNFIGEYTYCIEPGDSLYYIANAYDISARDLMEYNDLTSDIIYPNDEIIIPNNYTDKEALKVVDYNNLDFEIDDNVEDNESNISRDSGQFNRLVKGIDVSSWQGEIDWDIVKEQVDFAILRLCDFSCIDENGNVELDTEFLRNMQACEEKSIPVGVYYFSRATTKEEAQRESEFVAEQLKNYTLEYPVYMDAETPELENLMEYNPEQFESLVSAALGTLEDYGYYPGIYANKSRVDNILHLSDKYTFWLTSNETYDQDVKFIEFKNPTFSVEFMPNADVEMYQYSAYGRVDGIEDNVVDVDYASATLSENIINEGYAKVKTY